WPNTRAPSATTNAIRPTRRPYSTIAGPSSSRRNRLISLLIRKSLCRPVAVRHRSAIRHPLIKSETRAIIAQTFRGFFAVAGLRRSAGSAGDRDGLQIASELAEHDRDVLTQHQGAGCHDEGDQADEEAIFDHRRAILVAAEPVDELPHAEILFRTG